MGLHAGEPLLKGPMIGPLFETMIVSEWIKIYYNRGEKPELYYWRSKYGIEVDLIIDRNGMLYPSEVKSTSTVVPGHTESLNTWRSLAGDLSSTGVIVADAPDSFAVKNCMARSWKIAPDMI